MNPLLTPLTPEPVVIHGVPFDRWIIGEAADTATEYITHLSAPMFIAKFWDGDIDDADAADMLAQGTVFVGGTSFYDIVWFDAPPVTDDAVRALFREADQAIGRYTIRE